MKKLWLCMFLLCSVLVSAQNKVNAEDITELTFFGVDFSLARVYGADESGEQFKTAFTGINNLITSEPKKYDVPKAFPRKNVTVYLKPSLALIPDIDVSELFTSSNNYRLSPEELAAQIRKLNTDGFEGYGAVLVAGLLDKGKARATYHLIVFDIDTKEIVSDRVFTEKARGFGLRNYWAHSVYEVLKKAKKN